MKVKMLTIYASAAMTVPAGSVIDVPEAEARALVDGGYALADGDLATRTRVGKKAQAAAKPATQVPAVPPQLTPEQLAEQARAEADDLLEQAEAEDDAEVKARIIAEANKVLQDAGLPPVDAGAQ